MSRTCALLVLILPVACCPCCRRWASPDRPRVRIGGHVWRVELALDEPTRMKGLSGRQELPEGTGMLFAFPREEVLSFHMLNCHVALDIAFISSRLRVVEIRTMPVEPDPANPQATYGSREPARFALEVPAGALARAGVKIGDRVELLDGAADAVKAAR